MCRATFLPEHSAPTGPFQGPVRLSHETRGLPAALSGGCDRRPIPRRIDAGAPGSAPAYREGAEPAPADPHRGNSLSRRSAGGPRRRKDCPSVTTPTRGRSAVPDQELRSTHLWCQDDHSPMPLNKLLPTLYAVRAEESDVPGAGRVRTGVPGTLLHLAGSSCGPSGAACRGRIGSSVRGAHGLDDRSSVVCTRVRDLRRLP